MVKKREKNIFITNKYFKSAVLVMLITAIFLVQGLRTDNLFLLLSSIVLGVLGLFFIKKSWNFHAKKLKK
jgi:energy-coupling factor transporter transmembrane protein EcfT